MSTKRMTVSMVTMITLGSLALAGCGNAGSTAGSGPSSGGDGCSVQLFDGDDFDTDDDHFTLTEPGEYESLDSLPGAEQSWTDEADSLKVGSDAHVIIYSETGFAGDTATLDPGSEHPDLDVEPSSLKMTCSG